MALASCLALASTAVAEDAKRPDDSPGRLQIHITPWASVFVDGEAVGATPFKPLKWPATRHRPVLIVPNAGDYPPSQEPGRS